MTAEIRSAKELGFNLPDTHKYVWHACIECGRERWVQIRKGLPRSKLCRKCGLSHSRGLQPRGEAHYNWKGGRTHDARGYIKLLTKGHPKADCHGYVAEHVLVWERVHNQRLPCDYVIHHLNGIKNDNRPSNLVALLREKHYSTLHMEAVKKRVRELEAEVKLLEKAIEANQAIFRVSEN